jgi:hypothetical protein
MKRKLFVCGLVAGCCLRAAAETNTAPSTLCFALPAAHLRSLTQTGTDKASGLNRTEAKERASGDALPVELDRRLAPQTPATASEQIVAKADLFSLTFPGNERAAQFYQHLEAGGYLQRPEEETPLGRFMNSPFSPEVVHLGKASASCTLYTAIVRKNPLCLLNPLFLFVSW